MTNPWFKFYGSEFLLDPKLDEFTDSEIACWLILLCYASSSEISGVVRHLTEDKLMRKARVTSQRNKTIGVLQRFIEKGMITDDNGVITITNWEKRQERSLTSYERVKKFREKKRMITDETNDNDTDNVVDKRRREKIREEEIILPDWLNKKAWDAWVQYRKEIKKTLKPLTVKLQLKLLEENKDNHTAIIKNSITNGWTGLFPLKVEVFSGGRKSDKARAYEKRVDAENEERERKTSSESNELVRKATEMSRSLTEKFTKN